MVVGIGLRIRGVGLFGAGLQEAWRDVRGLARNFHEAVTQGLGFCKCLIGHGTNPAKLR